MGEFRKLTVELDDRAIELIDGVVGEGRFADASEVVRYAMLLFDDREREQQEADPDMDEDDLDRLWTEAEASGEPIEATPEFYEEIKRQGRARLAALRAAAE